MLCHLDTSRKEKNEGGRGLGRVRGDGVWFTELPFINGKGACICQVHLKYTSYIFTSSEIFSQDLVIPKLLNYM